jgi:hypothetical protein
MINRLAAVRRKEFTTMSKKAEKITAYKGFNKDLQCRDFQYEVGKTYAHKGDVVACSSGFHACEHPLNVFSYYPPAGSRFAEVTLSGTTNCDGSDTKIAAAKITIDVELSIGDLVKRAWDYVWSRATPEEGSSATGTRGAASATGTRGAASATGWQGAASATGEQGAASATGWQGAASATGTRGAAMACGYEGRAMGAEGNALFLVERDDNYNILAAWAGIVGKDGIKPNTWYILRDGKPEEIT